MNLDALLSPAGAMPFQFEGFLHELWTVWRNNVGRAVLLARWFWQTIPESVVQQAALINQQTQAASSYRDTERAVDLKLGAMGIFPGSRPSFGDSFGPSPTMMDPNAAIFLQIMAAIRAYQGEPPMGTASLGATLAEAVLLGQRDPVEVMIEAAPPDTKQQLIQAVQLTKMSGFYSFIQIEAVVLAAFALPRNRIPSLLPEAAADQASPRRTGAGETEAVAPGSGP